MRIPKAEIESDKYIQKYMEVHDISFDEARVRQTCRKCPSAFDVWLFWACIGFWIELTGLLALHRLVRSQTSLSCAIIARPTSRKESLRKRRALGTPSLRSRMDVPRLLKPEPQLGLAISCPPLNRARTRTRMHTRCTCAKTLSHIDRHLHIRTTLNSSLSRRSRYAHTDTDTDTRTQDTHTPTQTRTHPHPRPHPHAQVDAHAHAHAHSHVPTHTHTHTLLESVNA